MLPILTAIQDLLQITLRAAPRPHDPIYGLMAYHRQYSKYLLDQDGHLIGLNLSHTGLTDAQWEEISKMDGFETHRIKALNLSDNQLTTFRLGGMRHVEHLDVEDNPLTFPDESVMKQGQPAVLRFLKQIEDQGAENIYEIKMLILGEGGSGKTTLWKKLQDIHYQLPKEEVSTVGIQIKEGWSFPHRDQPSTPFLVNLWDFGGQEIQHMTHQFFLTRRSFYVVVSDGRRETGNFSYWFKIIQLLGCDPDTQTGRMPVFVVLNKRGVANISMPYDPEDAKRDFPDLDVLKYEVDFGKLDVDLRRLPEKIQELLCTRMDHLPLTFPSLWKEVREKLYRRREQQDYIQWRDYQDICEKIGIRDQQQMQDLSRTLHELGVILHYQENVLLYDFLVLRPQWAVNAVYEILNHEKVGQNQGRFDKQFLSWAWDQLGYSPTEQRFLMTLMLEDGFDVCFAAEEGAKKLFIAPQLLPDHRPSFAWEAGGEALRYLYHYPFMPKGLIGRLIVHLHRKIQSREDKKVIWKKGMLLIDEKSRAEAVVEELVEQSTGRELIRMTVIAAEAEDRRFLLREIRAELDKIHERSFPALAYYELVPCCCSVCAGSDTPEFFQLQDLEKKVKPTIECRRSEEYVSVQRLLRGVFEEKQVLGRHIHPQQERITKGQLKEALMGMLQACEGKTQTEVLLLLTRLNRLQEEIGLGVVPRQGDQTYAEWNQITKASLELCEKIYKNET